LVGFEVCRNQSKQMIVINQRSYIEAMLKRFGLSDVKPVYTPMEVGVEYSKKQFPISPRQVVKMPMLKQLDRLFGPSLLVVPTAAL
jgi:hypothetical protein